MHSRAGCVCGHVGASNLQSDIYSSFTSDFFLCDPETIATFLLFTL